MPDRIGLNETDLTLEERQALWAMFQAEHKERERARGGGLQLNGSCVCGLGDAIGYDPHLCRAVKKVMNILRVL